MSSTYVIMFQYSWSIAFELVFITSRSVILSRFRDFDAVLFSICSIPQVLIQSKTYELIINLTFDDRIIYLPFKWYLRRSNEMIRLYRA